MWDVTDRLTVVGGARIDPYWQRIVSNNTGETGLNIDAPVNDRIGGRYRLTDMIAVHANWGGSFSLNTGTNRNGSGFGPETGRSHEIGIAANLPGIDVAATWFDNRKQSILATDLSIRTTSRRSAAWSVGIEPGASARRRLSSEAPDQLLSG